MSEAAASPAISADDLVGQIADAVRSVVGAARPSVALHEPFFESSELKYVHECIETGWVSSVGKFVDRFEASLVEYTGARYAVATVNGTAALHVCLLLAGVRPGEEVLVPALTFIATANAVSYANAIPHFVESESRTLGVDAVALDAYLGDIAKLENGLCVNRQTGAVIRALMPMHVFGLPGDVSQWLELCRKWQLVLVEDAAESLGSFYRGRHTGTYGRLAGLSFNGNKIVTTGGGGAILTNDETLARRAKHLTTTARVPHRWSFIHDEVGFNYRMPNLNAALGVAQMERLSHFVTAKNELQRRYREAFQSVRSAKILSAQPGSTSNYWLVTLLLNVADAELRDRVLTRLNGDGLMSRPVWTLMHELPMYAGCPRMSLPTAVEMSARIINLPSSVLLVD